MSKSSDKRARRAKRAEKSRQRRSSDERGIGSFLHAVPDTDELLGGFDRWLTDTAIDQGPEQIEQMVDIVAATIASMSRLDPAFTPTAWTGDEIAAVIEDAEHRESINPGLPLAMLTGFALRLFVSYLFETGRWTLSEPEWYDAVDMLEAIVRADLPEAQPIIEDVDPEREAAALADVGVIRRLDALLDWIGRDKPSTPALWLKPALLPDLARVTGLDLGEGVKKMSDHRGLTALWLLAQDVELITVAGAKARPGPASYAWRTGDRLPVMQAAARLDLMLRAGGPDIGANDVQMLVRKILQDGITGLPVPESSIVLSDPEPDPADQALHEMFLEEMSGLLDDGWLTLDDQDCYVVPMALRALVNSVVADNPIDVADDDPILPPATPATLTLRLEMPDYISPPVWRRVTVSSTLWLGDLHVLIQALMAWNDGHLHQFIRRQGRRRPAEVFTRTDDFMHEGFAERTGAIDEYQVHIGSVLQKRGDELHYDYDFGDSWEVRIVLEDVGDPSADKVTVLDGSGTAPFDDVGGAGGWQYFQEVMKDPKHEEHADMREWAGLTSKGGNFDATGFDVDAANQLIKRMIAD